MLFVVTLMVSFRFHSGGYGPFGLYRTDSEMKQDAKQNNKYFILHPYYCSDAHCSYRSWTL